MDIDEKLRLCYEIIMQTARAGIFTARAVRTGYTHWFGRELSGEIRMFSGYVSEEAIENRTHIGLVLEHYLRIQTELTALIRRHMVDGENPEEFVSEVKRLEQVHIVTKRENNLLRTNRIRGNYQEAGIKLVHWVEVPPESLEYLRRKLRGQVANFEKFLG